jgi:DNA-binding winged helix-turn-helix (wHTH) protein/Tfp pilus assembly protein PilF
MLGEGIEFYKFDHFCLDKAARRLLSDDRVTPLPPKVFDILLLLIENSGQLLTKDWILNQVWADEFVEENNLTVRIAELRKILGESPGENIYIETVPRYGYRFVAKVRKVRDSNTETDDKAITSLAILPLINESNVSNLDYVCDGITESLINNLSQLSQIRVLSRTTVFRYQGRESEIRAISQELEAQAVLVGRISEVNSNLIVSLELINARDESQMWGARYNYPLSNLFTLPDQIAKEISISLRLKLTIDEQKHLTKRHTQNAEAYLLYLKGRHFWNKRNVEGVKRAIEYFEQAIKNDSNYALAYAGLADCYTFLFCSGANSPLQVISKAEAAAIKGLEIDESLAETHTSLGHIRLFYNRNWSEAEKEFERGIELNPNYVPGRYWYANYLTILGRFDEALFQIKQAQWIDPLSLVLIKAEGKILYFAGQYDEAIKKCLEVLDMDPNYTLANAVLGTAYLQNQMYEEAIQEFQKVLQFTAGGYKLLKGEETQSFTKFQKQLFLLESDPETIAHIGYIYAITGKSNKAIEILEGLKYLSECRYIEPHTIALVYIGLGDKDQAFEWLEKSYEDQSMILTFLKIYPLFDSLRTDPRFEALLQRIGFTA